MPVNRPLKFKDDKSTDTICVVTDISMAKVADYLISRLVWLGFGAGLGLFALYQGIDSHSTWSVFIGIGLILYGMEWFMRPQVLGKPIMTASESAVVAAIGPSSLYKALKWGGNIFLLVGFLLRIAS